MPKRTSALTLAALLSVSLPALASTATHRATNQHPSVRRVSRLHKSTRASLHHEAPSMDTERATQIQTALIKQGYLTGEPTGVWDAQSSAAMARLQADNGWQSKVTPDSRALIKLGLGPHNPPGDQVTAPRN